MADSSAAGPDSDEEVLDCSQALTVSFRIVKSVLEEVVVSMKLDRSMTPLEITTLWEQEWGVAYATRLKFEAPPEHGSKYLNHRSDVVPIRPAVVKVVAPSRGSVVEALLVAAPKHGATIDVWRHEDFGESGREMQPKMDGKAHKPKDSAFAKRLQKMQELQQKEMLSLEAKRLEFQQQLEEESALEAAQEERRREFQQKVLLMDIQRNRDVDKELWEVQQYRAQREKEQQELRERKEQQEQERIKQEQNERYHREMEEKRQREELARKEQEDQERRLRLAEQEQERKAKEEEDPKFRAAMEKRRARQEKNRLRQEAQLQHTNGSAKTETRCEEPIDTQLSIPEGLPSNIRRPVLAELSIGANSEAPCHEEKAMVESQVEAAAGASWRPLSFVAASRLQRELWDAFADEAFQARLQELGAQFGSTSPHFLGERQKLVHGVQISIIPKYGFKGDESGVADMMAAMANHEFMADTEFARVSLDIVRLLEPRLTWQQCKSEENAQKLQRPIAEPSSASKNGGVFRMPVVKQGVKNGHS